MSNVYTVIQLDENGNQLREIVFDNDEKLHFDDNIDTIKIKIILKLFNIEDNPIDEYDKNGMYLFCKRETEINSTDVVETLTKQGSRSKIKAEDFFNFFKNINSYCTDETCIPFIQPIPKEINEPKTSKKNKKSQQLLTDLEVMQLRLDGKRYIVDEVLGQRNTLLKYPIIVCDPFKNNKQFPVPNDPYSLLLNSGPIIENTIYMCYKETEEDGENIIRRGDDFSKYQANFDKVSALYDLFSQYNLRSPEDIEGITRISLSIVPEANYLSVATDNLFKIIHATIKNPVVAYRPYRKSSLVYRLYSGKKTKEDKKIPFIKKSVISKIEKIIKDDSVLVLIKYEEKDIICQISNAFEIEIMCDFENDCLTVDEINNIVRENVNPFLRSVSGFFERVGYKLNVFTSLNDTHRIKINDMSYTYACSGKDKIKVEVEGIDNINYLSTVPIYLKSLAVQRMLSEDELRLIRDICGEKKKGGEHSSTPEENPFASDEENSASPAKTPFKKDDGNSSTPENPFASDEEENSASPAKTPFKEDSTPENPFASDEEETPFKKDDGNSSTPENPFEKDSDEEGSTPAKAPKADSTSASDEEGSDEEEEESGSEELEQPIREEDKPPLPLPPPIVKKKVQIMNFFIKTICFDTIFQFDNEGNILYKRVSGNHENNGFNTIITTANANKENKMKMYLMSNPNKDSYTRYCQPLSRIPTLLDNEELAELKIKDPSYNDPNRVLTDGENNFVCESGSEYLYPRFNKNQLPCCNSKNKEQSKADDDSKDKNHITKFSSKQILEGQWSILPPELDLILNNNKGCGETINEKKNKNSECFLIYGVENSKTQSFISSLSSATVTQTSGRRRTIKEMKTAIINSLTLDNFIKYQNGNLVTDFQDPKDLLEKCEEIMNIKNIDNELRRSELYQKLDMRNKASEEYFKKVLSAYVNFINYLRDDDILIDYSYLWDIVCEPNPYIFKKGINLIIINVNSVGNLSVICPSNHYSRIMYNENNDTLFLIRKEVTDTYEPLYFRDKKTNKKEDILTISKLFLEKEVSPSMGALFDIVKPLLEDCRPFSEENLYTFKKPILLEDLILILSSSGGDDRNLKQIVNYNNKVIGITINGKQFVPCYPSSIKSELDYEFVRDESIWEDYKKTKANLIRLSKLKIPCSPLNKILDEKGYVVGILTEANQFVQLRYPERHNNDDDTEIPPLDDYNYILTNDDDDDGTEKLLMSNKLDRNRMDQTKRFKLENEFYNAFRNTVKIALNDFEDDRLIEIREQIENQIDSKFEVYTNQIVTITKLLKELIGNKVIFTGDENYYTLIDDVSTCINKIKDVEECDKTETCSKDGNCSLIVPRLNLINENRRNEHLYFKKMADEFVRYHYIRKQMFNPRKFIFFSNIDYNLRNNEIILLGSEVTHYFENLVPVPENKFVTFNSYDEVNPRTKGGKKTRRKNTSNNNKKKTRRKKTKK